MANDVFTAYHQRNSVLLGMGFESYRTYQRSSLWKGIRERQLMKQPWCTGCGAKAWQVHHLRYDKPTMMGRCSGNLVSVCGHCHFSCEFDAIGSKLSIDEVNKRLLAMLRRHPVAVRKNKQVGKVIKRNGTGAPERAFSPKQR
jgi:hypothetical protein